MARRSGTQFADQIGWQAESTWIQRSWIHHRRVSPTGRCHFRSNRDPAMSAADRCQLNGHAVAISRLFPEFVPHLSGVIVQSLCSLLAMTALFAYAYKPAFKFSIEHWIFLLFVLNIFHRSFLIREDFVILLTTFSL